MIRALNLLFLSVGILSTLNSLAKIGRLIRFFSRQSDLSKYKQEDNSWALITGSSDGLGYGFAEQLLQRGFNVVIHGSSAEQTESAKERLSHAYPCRGIQTIVADATNRDLDLDIFVRLATQLPGPLTVLVNNVGGQPTIPRHFVIRGARRNFIDQTIDINARFPTLLTSVLLPILQKNTASLIINSGSLGGITGTSFLAVYSATKAYIHTFSLSLQAEMVAEGNAHVDVMGCILGQTLTPNNPFKDQRLISMPAETAKACLDKVGSGAPLVYPTWSVWIQAQIYNAWSRTTQIRRANDISMKRRRAEFALQKTVKNDTGIS